MLSKSNFVLKGYNQHLCEFFFFTLQQGKGWSVRPLLFEIFKEKLLILAIDRNCMNSKILHLFVYTVYCVMPVFWQWGINIVFLLIFGKVHNNYKFMTQSRLKGYIVHLLSYKWGQWVDMWKKVQEIIIFELQLTAHFSKLESSFNQLGSYDLNI